MTEYLLAAVLFAGPWRAGGDRDRKAQGLVVGLNHGGRNRWGELGAVR